MPRSLFTIAAALAVFSATRAFGSDPSPTQWVSPDGNVYSPPTPVGNPFPSSVYGVLHGGSSFSLQRPFLSPFGRTDNTRGRFVYYADSFYPRGSEGVFGVDVWLEQQDALGNWNPANQNGGVSDDGTLYWTVNRTNPGPSASRTFTWTYADLPANTNFRVFVYVYIYNQGGGSSGYFPLSSSTQVVNTGATNDAPRIAWTQSPAQVTTGQDYTIATRGEDDNGDLATVSINRNGQAFAYAGGGNGYTGDSQGSRNDAVGTVTYTAWATDSSGASSPTISWTVTIVPKSNQPAVSSSNATITYLQSFTPSYFGGAGSGGWQFVVSGQTNFDPNDSSHSGTKLFPSNAWSSSWTPPRPDSYPFFVARVGDSNYNPSATAGPYTLTVLPVAPVGSFDAISATSVTQGQTVTGSGWAADAQLGAPLSSVTLLVDGGASGSITASLNGYRPDVQSANTSFGQWSPRDITYSGWSFSLSTSSLAAGAHTITAIANDSTYAVSANLGSKSFSVSALLGQTVSLTPSAPTVNVGDIVNFSATGAQNGYVWGGSASGSGSTKAVTFSTAGTFSVTVYSPAGGSYAQSNIATATITVVSNSSQTVAIAPASQTVGVGTSVTFTASGGVNGYAWSGSASGSGNSKTVTFPALGSYTVSAYSPAGGGYNQSNTATATITVTTNPQTVALTPATQTITVGDSINFSAAGGANGYVWGGAASGSGGTKAVTFSTAGTFSVTVYSPAGGSYAQSNIATATITVVSNASQTVAIAPASQTIGIGASVTFSASGGVNGYNWGGSASGSGNFKTVTFPAVGSYIVSAYSPAGGGYNQSNTATATITVANNSQTVALTPASQTITVGDTVNFSAVGGVNGYLWGGAASGSGSTKTISFNSPGAFSVTAYSPAGGGYSQSNTAASVITVNAITTTFSVAPTSFSYTGFVCAPTITASPAAATYSVSGTPSATNPGSYSFTVTATGNYAGSATIPWSIGLANQSAVALSPASATVTAGQTVTFTASGGSGTGTFAWGGGASGTGTSKTITFSSIGTASVTVYRAGDFTYGPSNTATASVNVVAATYALTVNAGLGGTAIGSATGLAGTATVAISATPSPGYVFAGWTGDPVADASANSTTVSIASANRSVTANFIASVAQTITFTPTATASYPSTPLTFSATASSGLPVAFALVSGPGIIAGNQLTISGTGIVIVRASQAGGSNAGVFFQPAPNVDRSIQVNPPFSILRLRFNTPANLDGAPTGNRSLDGDNLAHSAPPNKRSTYIFTNPAGLASSRWPHFNNPQRVQPVHANVQLPLAAIATLSSENAQLIDR
ncbi:MAG: hypothetical protein Q8N18_20555 [Opitutaceae bacterium]|nr:hypothetical protein [Opitutaceae bacterium]